MAGRGKIDLLVTEWKGSLAVSVYEGRWKPRAGDGEDRPGVGSWSFGGDEEGE